MRAGGVVAPGGGRSFPVGELELRVKVGLEQGHALLGIFEAAVPAGAGFTLAHAHDAYEEVFYVLEGELEYRLGDIWTAAPAGSTVCVPRGVVHTFRNASDRPARHLVAHAPVAALELIEELERVPQEAVEALLARHRTRLAGD
jgi:uncharacterized cupin superfamily protein